jgi:hypothetical protein
LALAPGAGIATSTRPREGALRHAKDPSRRLPRPGVGPFTPHRRRRNRPTAQRLRPPPLYPQGREGLGRGRARRRPCGYKILQKAHFRMTGRRESSASARCRVEEWRGSLGLAYLLPALSAAGASIASPCPVSTPRSSNRTGAFNASGSRTRLDHPFAHGERPAHPCRLYSPRSSYK